MPHALLIISAHHHHKVVLSDAGVHQLLGYKSEEVLGSSFLCFCGPSTDDELLRSCLEGACHSRSSAVQLVLYTKDGVEKSFLVRMAPFRKSGRVSGCTMILSKSEAISMNRAVQQERDCAHLLLSADSPFTLKNINASFQCTFGSAATLAVQVGHPISMFRGRRSSVEEWSRPFLTAANGLVSESSIVYARTRDCPNQQFSLLCEPVAMQENGKIALNSATFLPKREFSSAIIPAGSRLDSILKMAPHAPHADPLHESVLEPASYPIGTDNFTPNSGPRKPA
jgi:PAS domain S-box-containing protein